MEGVPRRELATALASMFVLETMSLTFLLAALKF
jgi:hypothetical protein